MRGYQRSLWPDCVKVKVDAVEVSKKVFRAVMSDGSIFEAEDKMQVWEMVREYQDRGLMEKK